MKRSRLVFNLTRVVSSVVLPARFDVRVQGLEHLPERGPVLLIPKHQQWWDVPLLGHYVPRPLHFLAKEELFRSPPARWFISRLGGIPVDRQAPLKSLNTFRSLVPLIREEAFLVLFPEGTYFPGTMGAGKWRLIRMILSFQQRQNLPTLSFLPVGIRYQSTAGRRRMGVEIRIGEPRQEKDPGRAQAFTGGLLGEVGRLSQLQKTEHRTSNVQHRTSNLKLQHASLRNDENKSKLGKVIPIMASYKSLLGFLLLFIFALSGCTTTPKPREGKGSGRVALVLGGGAARGFAHVGVIRVLEQEKIPIHLIVGTSVGSLIGGLYAADPNSANLEWLAYAIEKEDIFDYSVVYSRMGPVQGDRLEKFVQTKAKARNLEQLKIPFYPVATDLNTGQTWVFERGSLARAIRASSAIPGVFQPVEINGRTYVDGGVTNNLPVDVARSRGADVIIAVDIQKKLDHPQIGSLIDVILQSIDIMGRELVLYKCRDVDVLIEPNVGDVGMTDFSQKKRLMDAGMQAARQALPRIKKLIEEKS